MGPTGRRPTQAGSRLSACLDPRVGAATGRARHGATRARTRGDSGDGARRRGEAGPERAGESAHGEEGMAASLTGNSDSGERRRRSGATSRGGGGRTRAVTALQGRGKGRMRVKINGGEGGEALPAKNRATAHRGRRIGGGKELGAAVMGEGTG